MVYDTTNMSFVHELLFKLFVLCLLAATVKSESGSSMDNFGDSRTDESVNYTTVIYNLPLTLMPSSVIQDLEFSTSSSLALQTISVSQDVISISPSLPTPDILSSSLDPSLSQKVISSIILSPSPVHSLDISPVPTDTRGFSHELFPSTQDGALEPSTITQVVRISSVILEMEATPVPTSISTNSTTDMKFVMTGSRGSTKVNSEGKGHGR